MKLDKLISELNEDSYEVYRDEKNPKITNVAIIDNQGQVKKMGTLGLEIAKVVSAKLGNQVMNSKAIAERIVAKIREANNLDYEPTKSDLEISGNPTEGLKVIIKNEDGTAFASLSIVKDATQGANLYKIVG